MSKHSTEVELAVIGSGLAGLAASAFALNRGISVARVGGTGGLAFTTGYLDLLGISTSEHGGFLAEPLEGLDTLRAARPDHPYAKLANAEILAAFKEFVACLEGAGLPYSMEGNNILAFSPIGTLKCTYAAPLSMMAGAEAFAAGSPCLLVDFAGFKAFSAREIAVNLRSYWPHIRPLTLTFPDLAWSGELYAEAMARVLEVPATRDVLIEAIRPHLGDARCVGLPAVLGVHGSAEICAHMAQSLGVPVFEVPTLPPGVPGLRLRECMDDALRVKGMTLFTQLRVFSVKPDAGGFVLEIGENAPNAIVRAKAVLLASGRFLSGGLVGCRERGVLEPLLGLPVTAPASREDWHADDYFDPAGHGINRAGLAVDAQFRPVGPDGKPVYPNLFTAGAILAGQDWVREKSGAGISLASAWKAVESYAASRGQR